MEEKIFTPSHIANFILENAENENLPMTPLKMHKLVYLVYGWVRAVLDIRLFNEEIQAWDFGPVVPSLYHEFKRFGKSPIVYGTRSIYEDSNLTFPSITLDHPTINVMRKAWNVYKLFTAIALVNKTHEPHSPWAQHYIPYQNAPIPDEEIKEYFIRKIREYINYVD